VYAGPGSIRFAAFAGFALSTSSARLAIQSEREPLRIHRDLAELESIGIRALLEPLALTNERIQKN